MRKSNKSHSFITQVMLSCPCGDRKKGITGGYNFITDSCIIEKKTKTKNEYCENLFE